jgi:hypothetical protein
MENQNEVVTPVIEGGVEPKESRQEVSVTLYPLIAVTLLSLKDHLDDKRSVTAFINAVIRKAIETKAKAESRAIRGTVGQAMANRRRLGMKEEQVREIESEIQARADALEALALQLAS